MRVTDHISALLYRYECVVIPEFGAFLAKRQPARIDEATQAFHPPMKRLSFNRQLKENDGLLANYMAKTEQISYEQALKKIYEFVEDLQGGLEAHGKIALSQLGLFYTQGDKILFQPTTETNYLLEAFGMTAISPAQIARETATQAAEVPVKTLPTTFTEEEEYRRPVYWRYAAIGVLAIGLGSFLTASWYSGKITSHNLAAQEQAEQHLQNKIQKATFVIEDPLPEITLNIDAQQGKYHIVAGAFRNEANVQKKLKKLRAEGFIHAKYIGENKYGLHEVVYDSFENRHEALTALRKIRQHTNAQAWLLVKSL